MVSGSWREFGGSGTAPTWPLDQLADAGLMPVPGFVVRLAGVAAEPDSLYRQSLLKILDGANVLTMGEDIGRIGGCRATAEWIADPILMGIPAALPMWDFAGLNDSLNWGDSEVLHDLKHFIESFARLTCPSVISTFSQVDDEILTDQACDRDRRLSSEALAHVIARYLSAYSEATMRPFPRTLPEQVAEVATHLGAKQSQAIPTAAGQYVLELCIARRFGDRECDCCGFVYSEIAAPVMSSPRGVYAEAGCDRLEAGTVEVKSLGELVDSNRGLAEGVGELQRYVDNLAPSPLRLSFVSVGDAILVSGLRALNPVADSVAGLAAEAECFGTRFSCAFDWLRPELVDRVLLPQADSEEIRGLSLVATGLGAGGGFCSGRLVLDSNYHVGTEKSGPHVFMAASPLPELMPAILQAEGLIFCTGGATSHVAVIARGAGKACVMAVSGAKVQQDEGLVTFGGETVRAGEWVTLDGSAGRVYAGRAHVRTPTLDELPGLKTILASCDAVASVSVYANADTSEETAKALLMGARGVGLCRTEHLLARPQTMQLLQGILAIAWSRREMLSRYRRTKMSSLVWGASAGAQGDFRAAEMALLEDPLVCDYLARVEEIEIALAAEVSAILSAARQRDVFIRLLDPPVAEFLSEAGIEELRRSGRVSASEVDDLLSFIDGHDSTMGIRGVRVSTLAPHLEGAQYRAILRAMELASSGTVGAKVGIILPFVIAPEEVAQAKMALQAEIDALATRGGTSVSPPLLGAMIETPRAAVMAAEIAAHCDFLSIGTNDLSQFTWACSRDAADLSYLSSAGLSDPFAVFDRIGVGRLLESTVAEARKANPRIRIGVCGEHAGLPEAAAYFAGLGVDYVSCSVQRIPAVRLSLGSPSVAKAGSRGED